jgi:hypothetical protein
MLNKKVYIEAYDKDNKQILGNLDGQTVIYAKNYKQTSQYKDLKHIGLGGDSKHVAYWKARVFINDTDEYKTIEQFKNKKHKIAIPAKTR